MPLSHDEFRDLTRQFLSESINEQVEVSDSDLARTEKQYGRTESGSPQSYADFAQRLDNIVKLIEDLSMDYVDSEWLADGDHSSLAKDVDNLFSASDTLSMAALGLAQNMGEI